jgi:hypothetical protein
MPTKLVPVSEWIYNLYRVKFWSGDPEHGGQLLFTKHFASSNRSHLTSSVNDVAPKHCQWYGWEVVKENVGHPQTIGYLYGMPVVETALIHGTRLADNSINRRPVLASAL